jgi:hypothetical protein
LHLFLEKKQKESLKKITVVKEIQADENKVKAIKLKAEKDKKDIVMTMIKESEELEKLALKQVNV